jgi:hypothetical protein
MHDHDQRFKTLIREFFGESLQLFFAQWAARFDCTQIEWLDKEVFPDAPQGSRSVLDLVAKLPAREKILDGDAEAESWLALVHIEIESPDKVAPLRPRMFRYYVHLRDRYKLPVLPIGLYLKVGLDGIGIDVYEEHFWELEAVRFQYLYVGLPGLRAVEYINSENWLGVALTALMKIPKDKVAFMGMEALRRLSDAPLSDQKRYLLTECVQAYLPPMDEAQKSEVERLMVTERYSGVRAMNKTWFEEGIERVVEKGIEKGIEKERREMLQERMEDRFGPLLPFITKRLEQMSLDELMAVRQAIRHAQSLSDLGFDK